MSSKRHTAVLVDQHPLWLEAVQEVLTKIHVETVGKATGPDHALALVEERQPTVLVTGIKMPGGEMDGIDLIRTARERLPRLKTVVFSMYEGVDHVNAAFSAGAVAYVVKTAHPDDLASAIRQAFASSFYLAMPKTQSSVEPLPELDNSPGLTRRELEILQLVAEGLSNAELARKVWVTEQTVKFHLSNIYRKLSVSNRTEASRWAQLHGLLPTPSARFTAV
jgi:DNA-binding NarL/FixJ family response regulator